MDKHSLKWIVFAGALLAATMGAGAGELSKAELEAWFESDDFGPPKPVNTGSLEFLTSAPHAKTLRVDLNLRVTRRSIDTGWVQISQCYRRLDPIPRVQVIYPYYYIDDLEVVSRRGIDRAWVDGRSVQLEGVNEGAALCTKARVRIFYQNPDGSFSLVNGPFQRKFLDGYHPMVVDMTVVYPPEKLRRGQVLPALEDGFTVETRRGRIHLRAHFEGKLKTELRFEAVDGS